MKPLIIRSKLIFAVIAFILAGFALGTPITHAQVASLRLDKVASSNFANPESTIDYTITVTNQSEVPVTNLVVAESWPPEFTLNGKTGGFATWTIDTLAPGASNTSILTVSIPKGLAAGNYISSTTAISQEPPLQETRQDSLEIRSVAVLSSSLPSTGGNDFLWITLALIINCSLIATYSFNRYLSHV
ncbi:MAG: NEW3 domain-containing protein [Candidatus Komeilibacteria bacterium]